MTGDHAAKLQCACSTAEHADDADRAACLYSGSRFFKRIGATDLHDMIDTCAIGYVAGGFVPVRCGFVVDEMIGTQVSGHVQFFIAG